MIDQGIRRAQVARGWGRINDRLLGAVPDVAVDDAVVPGGLPTGIAVTLGGIPVPEDGGFPEQIALGVVVGVVDEVLGGGGAVPGDGLHGERAVAVLAVGAGIVTLHAARVGADEAALEDGPGR
jgi:hypothetical protein